MTVTASSWPDWLGDVWAKSAEKGAGGEPESLAQHTWYVLERLAELIRLRPGLPQTIGVPHLWNTLFWAAFLHDFGKAASGFQVRLRGGEHVLDATQVRAGCCRYRGGDARHVFAAERILRKETRGHGTSRVLPPVGPRERDDYVFTIPDSGWISLTVDLLGPDAADLKADAWITGYEAPARQTILMDRPPADGPLLPVHPHGFARSLRL